MTGINESLPVSQVGGGAGDGLELWGRCTRRQPVQFDNASFLRRYDVCVYVYSWRDATHPVCV